MSAVLPQVGSVSSFGSKASFRSKSQPSKFQPTSQARFGYLGHLSLREAQGNTEALRNVSALDGTSFLPNVMTMQRASTPWQYNTPERLLEEPVNIEDEEEEQSQTLAQTSVQGSKTLSNAVSKKSLSASQPLPANYVRRIRRRAQKSLHNEARSWKQDIADLKLLADSASRSGNIYQALQAYHKMGVILDNQEMYHEAIQKYKQFLSLCITSKNTQGEALAYNCLGIDSFKVGQHDESIQYHNKHLELADGTGRLIAHTNLGIVFQAMGLSEHAAIHHQHAIEYANRMGAKDAQCFSVGNLAVASAAQGDLQTSRICLQYHLSAAQRQKQSMGDSKFALQTLKNVSNSAYHRLGQVNAMAEKFDEASSHFEKAIEVAKSKGDQQSEEKSSVMFGVAKGLMNFDKQLEALLQGQSPPKHGIEQQ
jgi:tetratricopeptide (TPR) repeat protein|mmetsp:Transcript_28448/g.45682  ORF Transcript_28448/g.45682 Transcript_28448/m.45682 type:complete len:424 (+) Transcript_28448:85-1356(+)